MNRCNVFFGDLNCYSSRVAESSADRTKTIAIDALRRLLPRNAKKNDVFATLFADSLCKMFAIDIHEIRRVYAVDFQLPTIGSNCLCLQENVWFNRIIYKTECEPAVLIGGHIIALVLFAVEIALDFDDPTMM